MYFAVVETIPCTVEQFVPGSCVKYINNNGICKVPLNKNFIYIYAKAETLEHFTYSITDQEMMVLNLQGSKYMLYDPDLTSV